MLQKRLGILSNKKKMIYTQISTTEKALVELHKTDETHVYKIIGNILIKKNVDMLIKELEENKTMMASELKKTETEFETNLLKYKRFGAEFNTNHNMPSNDHTLDDDKSIFDMSKLIKDTDN